jgi:hypothetical protein
MAHIVTCIYCKQKFDRDKVPFSKISERRYAHQACVAGTVVEKTKEEKDYDALIEYAKHLLKDTYNDARVRKQIKDFKEQYDYSFSGMLKSLIWFYEIKGNSTEKANSGIGIIPFVYNDALNYYYAIYVANLANQEIENYQPEVREIIIKSPVAEIKKPKLFKLEDDD